MLVGQSAQVLLSDQRTNEPKMLTRAKTPNHMMEGGVNNAQKKPKVVAETKQLRGAHAVF